MLDLVRDLIETLTGIRLSPDDDFFEAGGDSYSAIQFAVAITQHVTNTVPLNILVKLRTTRAVADWLEEPE